MEDRLRIFRESKKDNLATKENNAPLNKNIPRISTSSSLLLKSQTLAVGNVNSRTVKSQTQGDRNGSSTVKSNLIKPEEKRRSFSRPIPSSIPSKTSKPILGGGGMKDSIPSKSKNVIIEQKEKTIKQNQRLPTSIEINNKLQEYVMLAENTDITIARSFMASVPLENNMKNIENQAIYWLKWIKTEVDANENEYVMELFSKAKKAVKSKSGLQALLTSEERFFTINTSLKIDVNSSSNQSGEMQKIEESNDISFTDNMHGQDNKDDNSNDNNDNDNMDLDHSDNDHNDFCAPKLLRFSLGEPDLPDKPLSTDQLKRDRNTINNDKNTINNANDNEKMYIENNEVMDTECVKQNGSSSSSSSSSSSAHNNINNKDKSNVLKSDKKTAHKIDKKSAHKSENKAHKSVEKSTKKLQGNDVDDVSSGASLFILLGLGYNSGDDDKDNNDMSNIKSNPKSVTKSAPKSTQKSTEKSALKRALKRALKSTVKATKSTTKSAMTSVVKSAAKNVKVAARRGAVIVRRVRIGNDDIFSSDDEDDNDNENEYNNGCNSSSNEKGDRYSKRSSSSSSMSSVTIDSSGKNKNIAMMLSKENAILNAAVGVNDMSNKRSNDAMVIDNNDKNENTDKHAHEHGDKYSGLDRVDGGMTTDQPPTKRTVVSRRNAVSFASTTSTSDSSRDGGVQGEKLISDVNDVADIFNEASLNSGGNGRSRRLSGTNINTGSGKKALAKRKDTPKNAGRPAFSKPSNSVSSWQEFDSDEKASEVYGSYFSSMVDDQEAEGDDFDLLATTPVVREKGRRMSRRFSSAGK